MRTQNFTRVATSAVLAGLLTFPTSALAATKLFVGDGEYDEGTEASGEGWTWDGADDMSLNGYNNGGIRAWGDLVITVSGENTITAEGEHGIWASGVTLQGDGTLNIDADYTGIYAYPGYDGVSIDGVTVNINGGEDSFGIYSSGDITINDATVNINVANEGLVTENDMTITRSHVDVEAGAPIWAGGWLSLQEDPDATILTIDTSRVHAVQTSDYFGTAVMAAGTASDSAIQLINERGDTTIETAEDIDGYGTDATQLNGDDNDKTDILLEPLEDVEEEATVTRTITYVFEDGSEAAPTKSDSLTFTRKGTHDMLDDITEWDEWEAQSFADVESPVIEGYTAKLVVVAGESVDGSSDDLTYEVVYVKDEEPAPEPEPEPTPEPEPAPTPEPAKPAVPQTGDVVSGAQGLAAGIGALLAAAGATLKRRED